MTSLQQRIPNVGTSARPAWTIFGTGTLMAWKGEGADQGIYWSTAPSKMPDSDSGSTWAPQQQVANIGSSAAPALATLKGVVYMVSKGESNDSSLYVSRFDGKTWAPQRNIPGAGGSSDGPALAVTGDRLYMAWKDESDGTRIFWSSSEDGESWTPQAVIQGVGTSAGPALASDGDGAMFLAWKGEADDVWVWWSKCEDGKTWTPQQRACAATFGRPSIAVDANRTKWIAFPGPGAPSVGISPGIFFTRLVDEQNNKWTPPVMRLGFTFAAGPALLSTGTGETGLLLAAMDSGAGSPGVAPIICAPLLLPDQNVYFLLDQFIVRNMRTGHLGLKDGSDTIYATIGYKIKGQPAVLHAQSLGNMTGGPYNTSVSTGQIKLQDTDTIYFGYFAVNSSQGLNSASQYVNSVVTSLVNAVERADEAAITSLTGVPLSELSSQEAGTLLGAQIGFSIPGVGVILGAAAGWLADNVWNFAFPDCDGPVAFAWYAYGAPFIRNLLTNGPHAQTDDHPGSNSAGGCGSNSDYEVAWRLRNW